MGFAGETPTDLRRGVLLSGCVGRGLERRDAGRALFVGSPQKGRFWAAEEAVRKRLMNPSSHQTKKRRAEHMSTAQAGLAAA
jgi:hypothetical protein